LLGSERCGPVAKQGAHDHAVKCTRRQGLRGVAVRVRVEPQHGQRLAMRSACGGDRRKVHTAVAADCDHPIIDADQGVLVSNPAAGLDLGLWHGHDQHSCVLHCPIGCW